MNASNIVSFFINTFISIFVSIWQTMESIPISFGGFSIGLGSFSLCIIVIGVVLTIFLSFVNVGNVRTAYSSAERKNRR